MFPTSREHAGEASCAALGRADLPCLLMDRFYDNPPLEILRAVYPTANFAFP